jgi:hypothetical protein
MDRFVQWREQEHQDDAVQQHGQQKPGGVSRRPHHGAGGGQGAKMAGQLDEALQVRADREMQQSAPLRGSRRGVDRVSGGHHASSTDSAAQRIRP